MDRDASAHVALLVQSQHRGRATRWGRAFRGGRFLASCGATRQGAPGAGGLAGSDADTASPSGHPRARVLHVIRRLLQSRPTGFADVRVLCGQRTALSGNAAVRLTTEFRRLV
eukprot:SAG11_NODE_17726_length_510_cov_1.318735_1_plen_112_part_10